MSIPINREFKLPISRELKLVLETKRQEYSERMNQPNCSWVCWQQCDLTSRHKNDPNFRLLYYKFVVLSTILLANEKLEAKIALGTNNVPHVIKSSCIERDLSDSLNRTIFPSEFDTACDVVERYMTGKEQET